MPQLLKPILTFVHFSIYWKLKNRTLFPTLSCTFLFYHKRLSSYLPPFQEYKLQERILPIVSSKVFSTCHISNTTKWVTARCWDYEDEKHTGLAPEWLGVMGERPLPKGGLGAERSAPWVREQGTNLMGHLVRGLMGKGAFIWARRGVPQSEKLEKVILGVRNRMKVHKGPKEHGGTFRNLQWLPHGWEVAAWRHVAWEAGWWSLAMTLGARPKSGF